MKKIFLVLVLLGFIIPSACGGNSRNNSTSQNNGVLETVPAEYDGKANPLGPDASAEGAKIYQTNCATCHGPLGHGDGPVGESLDPKPKNLAELQTAAADDYMFWRISEGRPGTSMPPWKNILTEEQIWQTVAFLRTLE